MSVKPFFSQRINKLTAMHSTRVACLCLLVITFQWVLPSPVSAQNITRSMANQLLARLQNTTDTTRISTLIELGKFQIYKAGEVRLDLDSAFAYLQEAQGLSRKLRLQKELHKVESLLSVAYVERGDYQTGKAHFDNLIAECRLSGDKETEAEANYRFATCVRYILQKYPDAFSYYNEAERILRLYIIRRRKFRRLNKLLHFMKTLAIWTWQKKNSWWS